MPEIDKDVKEFRDLFLIAAENADPHFQLASRLYALWRGKKPWQLSGTSSQIMCNIAHSMVLERSIKLKKNIFGGEDFVSLEALHPRYESGREQAESWLRNVLRDESQINILADIEPTLQSALILGNGYRMPYAEKRDGKWFCSSRDVDYFQILPAPVGGRINPQNIHDDDAMPWFMFVDWLTDKQIKDKYSHTAGYQKDQAEKLFNSEVMNQGQIDNLYRDISNIIGGVSYGQDKNNWRTRINDVLPKDGEGRRRRVVHWFSRTDAKWRIIAQDQFLIYNGPLPMGDGILPLANYRVTNDLQSHWGIGALEMQEDIICAFLLNWNYRLDHLSRVIFPATWIREDIMGGRPESDFYARPYAVHVFPRTVQRLSDAMVVDRMPEVSPQTFLEDKNFRELLETVGGSPNMAETLGGSNAVGSSATGTLSFINQVSGRVDAESMLLEYGGLSQECRQLLILAGKYISEETFVRNAKSPNGTGWMSVDAENLGDFYVIRTHGTKSTADAAAAFQKIMALYPLWNNDPAISHDELVRQTAEVAGIKNINRLVRVQEPGQNVAPGATPITGELGGMASPQSIQNRQRSVQGAIQKPAGQPF